MTFHLLITPLFSSQSIHFVCWIFNHFESRLIALANPEDSWVAKWQKISSVLLILSYFCVD